MRQGCWQFLQLDFGDLYRREWLAGTSKLLLPCLEKVAGYARFHARVGVPSIHQRRLGHRLLWIDQGHERLGHRRDVCAAPAGFHSF